MSEAIEYTDYRSNEALSEKLKQAYDEGIRYNTIEAESGVNRGQVSQMANHPTEAILSAERKKTLWDWVDKHEAIRSQHTAQKSAAGEYKTGLSIIPTESYTQALGMCKFAQAQHGFAIITGMPGVGKTTIVNELPKILPHAVCLEASSPTADYALRVCLRVRRVNGMLEVYAGEAWAQESTNPTYMILYYPRILYKVSGGGTSLQIKCSAAIGDENSVSTLTLRRL